MQIMADNYVSDGDLGSGEPGSLSWHKLSVAEMSRDERLVYFREALPGMSADDAFSFMGFLIKEEIRQYGDGN